MINFLHKMNKIFFFSGIIITILLVYWELYLGDKIKIFNYISDWGRYLLIVPMISCYAFSFQKPNNTNLANTIFMISLGIITIILLDRDLLNSSWVIKICATIIGGLVMLFISRRWN